MADKPFPNWHGTTILSVRKNGKVIIAGDGQVSLGDTVIKANARKVRTLGDGSVIVGFAGATADAFTLFERLEAKLEQYPGQLTRACVEMAKDWRTDRYLRRLEAMMAVADADVSLVLTGTGDVLEPDDGIIALDNGVYKIWFARNYKAFLPNTVLLDNALATMGAGLPSAIGAKIVHPDRKVMAICGDGGFMMNSQEMETAVRLGLNLVVMVLRDDAYGMIKWKQAGMGFPDFGLDYGNPDFVKYAEAYGAHGHRLQATDQLPALLDECLNSPGVHLVEIPVDYSENKKVLIDELNSITCIQ